MFDLKMDAPAEIRGEFRPIDTAVPGIQICEHLPLLAKQAHRYAIIRSTWHGSDTHGVGVHYNLTGLKHAPRTAGEPQVDRRDPPCIGSVIRHLRGDRNGLPAAVQLPRQVGDQNNAYWGGQQVHPDLGIYMNRRSALAYYLLQILAAVCGVIGVRGGNVVPGVIRPLGSHADERNGKVWRTVATGMFPAAGGFYPPAVVPEER